MNEGTEMINILFIVKMKLVNTFMRNLKDL